MGEAQEVSVRRMLECACWKADTALFFVAEVVKTFGGPELHSQESQAVTALRSLSAYIEG